MKSLFKYLLVSLAILNAPSAYSSLLTVDYSKNFPFGPFGTDQSITIYATATNNSPDQTISICEGVCLGNANTYSLGALVSIPQDYTFSWGTGPDSSLGFLNGQLAGELLPNQTKDFVFGLFTPTTIPQLGTHNFSVQLQIFDATVARPMIDSPTFSGSFQAVEASPVPLPATLWLFLTGAGFMLCKRRTTI